MHTWVWCNLIAFLTIQKSSSVLFVTITMKERRVDRSHPDCLVSFFRNFTAMHCLTVVHKLIIYLFYIILGTPEMAFIHALAAATTASFIARACRDGQLASCGCSRSVRPSQLHEDWTWGGCGDDLEFGYKWVWLLKKDYALNLFEMKYSTISSSQSLWSLIRANVFVDEIKFVVLVHFQYQFSKKQQRTSKHQQSRIDDYVYLQTS